MFQFHCPHCATPLRLQDRSFRNRTISCPECGEPVAIVEQGDELVGTRLEEKPAVPSQTSRPENGGHWPRRVGLGVAVLLLGALLLYSLNGPEPLQDASKAAADSGKESGPENTRPADPIAQRELPKEEVPDSPKDQLTGIYHLIAAHLQNRGAFPHAEEPPSHSWIAELAERQLPEKPVDWSLGWSAHVNDGFVRRRFPAFLNPRLPQQAGDDQYPATHFVGVSGVGPDAAQLSVRHPRAGIFRSLSPTHADDVTDGLANTFLVAGVQSHLGSWARHGTATSRAFTEPPYVNGPDGFGTGEADRMDVLMADGSVRSLSAKTDPVIVRRLAAMADGLSLDPSTPGDPLAMTLDVKPAPLDKPKAGPPEQEDVPIQVPLAPDLPAWNFDRTLSQKIVAFELERPIPLQALLRDLEELVGAPFDLTQLSDEDLSQTVSITLHDVTVKEVLHEVLRSAGLTCQQQRDRLVIRPL